MLKKKITVTTGTRAEYGLLRSILQQISQSKKLELYLIVTGTHLSKQHGNTIKEIKKDGLKIFTTFDMLPKGDDNYHMAEIVGKGIIHFAKVFKKIKPDLNLILGDRDEMLASAIAAYHMNIPNAHIHGGEISGGIDEYTRNAILKISNIHFAITKKSKQRILKMGENPKYTFFTGSPAIDEVSRNRITDKKTLQKKYDIQLNGNEIILVQHSVTTQYDLTEKHIKNTLSAITKLHKPIIAIAPNTDSGSKKIFKQIKLFSKKNSLIKLYASMPRSDYLGLLKYAGVLVGNSSSGIIEASHFNIPVVNIGIRQKNRERGKNIFDVTNDSSQLIQKAIMKAIPTKNKKFKILSIYGDGNASKKIVKILEKLKLTDDLIQKKFID